MFPRPDPSNTGSNSAPAITESAITGSAITATIVALTNPIFLGRVDRRETDPSQNHRYAADSSIHDPRRRHTDGDAAYGSVSPAR
jgi:hypothetical protein